MKQNRGLAVCRMTVGINLRDSTVHRKQHIMTVETTECVGEIKFHQHNLASMPQDIDVLNGWLPRNLLAYQLQADLDRSIPESVNVKRICALRSQTPKRKQTHLVLTNPRDAFRGQSRSPNIVPFHIIGIVSSCLIVTLSLRRAFFPIFDFKKCRDLEIRVRGHSRSLKLVP